jgi:hypothetical protein
MQQVWDVIIFQTIRAILDESYKDCPDIELLFSYQAWSQHQQHEYSTLGNYTG